jgi:hypothetical protein
MKFDRDFPDGSFPGKEVLAAYCGSRYICYINHWKIKTIECLTGMHAP